MKINYRIFGPVAGGLIIMALFLSHVFGNGSETKRTFNNTGLRGMYFNFNGLTPVAGSTMPDLSGHKVLAMVSPTCPHCSTLLHLLGKSGYKYKGRPVIVLVKGLQSRDLMSTKLKNEGIEYPVFVMDPNEVMDRVKYVPTFLFLNKDNAVVESATVVVEDLEKLDLLISDLAKDTVHVAYQTSLESCGAACLSMVFDHYRIRVPIDTIEKSVVEPGIGSKMITLKRYAIDHGLKAEGWKLSFIDLATAPKPAIALIDQSHFVVIDSIVSGVVNMRDPLAGHQRIDMPMFVKRWSGETLIFRSNGPSFTKDSASCNCTF